MSREDGAAQGGTGPSARPGPLARLAELVVRRPRTIVFLWCLLAIGGAVATTKLYDRLANRGVAVPGSQSVLADDLARDHVYGEDRSRVSVVVAMHAGRPTARERRAVARALRREARERRREAQRRLAEQRRRAAALGVPLPPGAPGTPGSTAAPGSPAAPGAPATPGAPAAPQRLSRAQRRRIAARERRRATQARRRALAQLRGAALRRTARRVRRAVADAPSVAELLDTRYVDRAGVALIPVDLRATLPQAQKRLPALRDAATGAAPHAQLTVVGEAATYERYAAIAREDLERTEKISFPATTAIILVAFLSIVAAGVPVVLAGLGLLVTFGVLWAITQFAGLSVFAANTALALGLGLSIDYALFNVTRFREGLRRNGGDIPAAVRETVTTTGRAIAFSGLTVAAALASLLIVGVGVFSGMALGAIAAALVAVAGGLTLVPAVLVLGGRHLDRLAIRRAVAAAESARLWKAIAASVLRRRLAYAVGFTALLLALTIPVLDMRIAFPTATALPSDEPVRTVPEQLGARIGEGAFTPVKVVARGRSRRLVRELRRDRGLRPPFEVRRGEGGWVQVLAPLRASTDSRASQETVRRLRRELTEGSRPLALAVGGATATGIDNVDRLDARAPAVIAVALGFSILLMLLAFRSVVVPVKAALTTLVSVGATLGILALLYGELGLGSSGELSYFVPLFLFAVIFGLSTDYEVFLISRIREEYLAGASPDESISRGLVNSARSITLAGLVMTAVFLAQSTSKMEPLQQLGLGMAIAVLIDIAIVRTFLVPATMALLGRRNWWLPRFGRGGEAAPAADAPEPAGEPPAPAPVAPSVPAPEPGSHS